MKIYTKTGDKGTTSLVDGTRVSKTNQLLNAYGTVDELNSFIGSLIAVEPDEMLTEIQRQLFFAGWNVGHADGKMGEILEEFGHSSVHFKSGGED